MNYLKYALLKVDALLTPRRVKHYPIMALVVMLLGLSMNIAGGNLPLDAFGTPITFDFSAYVTGGRIALEGEPHLLYNLNHQSKVQQKLLGGIDVGNINIYLTPPFVAYLYVPFAALPYLVSAALWTIFTIILLALSLHLLWPLVPNLHRYGFARILVVAFATAPTMELLGDGQNSAVSLILFTLGLRLLLVRRDLMAGSVLALGLFKPQLFVLVPILLLLQRRWRALGAWSAVAAVLTAVSVALVGPSGIRAYLDLLSSDIYREKLAEGAAWKMLSLAALVRHLGFEDFVPFVVSAIMLVLMMLFGRSAARRGDACHFVLLYAVSMLMTFIFSPHLFLYDGVLLLLPALILLNEASASPGVRVSLVAAYVTTLFTPLGALHYPGLAPGPWIVVPIVALLLIAWQLLSQGNAAEQGIA